LGTGGEGDARERQDRHAGDQAEHAGCRRDHTQGDRIGRQLRDQRLVGRALDPGLGHQKTGGDRHNQGRNLGNQTIADGHHHIGVGSVASWHLVLQHPDQDAADGIDGGDDQAGHGVAANEFGRTVHGPEEGRFLLQLLAAALGLGFVNQAGGQIGIDRHLFAGH